MNNVRDKGVKITLDKERTMKFDLNALCELEEAFGTLEEAFKSLEKMSMKAIRKLLHASLVHEDESLTEKQVGQLIDINNIQYVAQKIQEAFQESSPKAEENTEKK
ncbi:hypothetical protein [Bacillus alveayuensis]|uniref:hypothetical protein n=1 Tax=Aeribacillus alveayuensis TaxID=279215 RepID=UPI0005D0EDCB|nr:hypothetical protein [Bacillus alveayuensis]